MGSRDNVFYAHLKVYRFTVSINPFHIIEKTRCTSTEGNDGIVHRGGGVEHLLLEFSKGFFSVAFEENRDGGMVAELEHLV